jgi:hypothetical protein
MQFRAVEGKQPLGEEWVNPNPHYIKTIDKVMSMVKFKKLLPVKR